MQLLALQKTQQLRLLELEAVGNEAQQAALAASQREHATTQELSETRVCMAEQQLQLQAAVDLQGRTHARLMQLTAEHDQVRLPAATPRAARHVAPQPCAADAAPRASVPSAAHTGSGLRSG
jgi:hypothetical protein